MKKLLSLLLVLSFAAAEISAQSVSDQHVLQITQDQEHTYVFTNKEAGSWYAYANRNEILGYMGWTISERHYISDLNISSGGKRLNRDAAKEITLKFDGIYYHYDQLGYRFSLVENKNILMVRTDKVKAPYSIDWQLASEKNNYKIVKINERVIQLTWDNKTEYEKKNSRPHKLFFISTEPFNAMLKTSRELKLEFQKKETYLLVVAEDKTELINLSRTELKKSAQNWQREKNSRLEKLLSRSRFSCDNIQLTKAVAWAKISLDALVMNQKGRGIYAGLPWFNNYWGRDTFISFPGAIYVNGEFETGREILSNFAKWQNNDVASKEFGRIPNRVTIEDKIYNTADGTPLFLLQLINWLHYGASYEDLKPFFPVIQKAIEGALANKVDEFGFLTHDDADSWMDAKGSNGAWSPRGNRAVEIQLYWLRVLEESAKLAEHYGNTSLSAQWLGAYQKAKENFIKMYWDGQTLYDHLNSDNTPDLQLRPNQLLATHYGALDVFSQAQVKSIVRTVFTKLTYPYGVASLYQFDKNFHPWHHYKPFYVQDAAYHNGNVWTWLSGSVITSLSVLNQTDNAYQLLNEIARQIIVEGAIGTQSELLDALPRVGKKFPQLSGTVSQAWNLAEFNRNIHEDLMGIQPQLEKSRILFKPMFPDSIKWAKVEQNFANNGKISVDYSRDAEMIHINYRWSGTKGITALFMPPLFGGEKIDAFLEPDKIYSMKIKTGDNLIQVNLDGNEYNFRVASNEKWPFAKPMLDVSLRSLRGPEWELLDASEIQFSPRSELVLHKKDPKGDDKGHNGAYLYPTDIHFTKGMFDLTDFKIFKDPRKYYFEINYSDLNESEYRANLGYDFTYSIIILDITNDNNGNRRIGRNSGFWLAKGKSAKYALYIGNGLLLIDLVNRRVVAEYMPSENGPLLGDSKNNRIMFGIPKKYLKGVNMDSEHILLSGGLNDHGGDGVGEFRVVKSGKATQWHGGGKSTSADKKNYYDLMIVK